MLRFYETHWNVVSFVSLTDFNVELQLIEDNYVIIMSKLQSHEIM